MTHSTTHPSLFIAIEGIDFSGKTTLITKLQKILAEDSLINKYFNQIIYTKEPNSNHSEVCHNIKKIAVENGEINDLTRALLFFANRSEHVSKVIQPAINQGRSLIICDRFYLSTLVYQIKRQTGLLKWAQLTQKIICPNPPGWTYFIKINKDLFRARYQENVNREKNLLDKLTYEKFDEVSNLYDWFIKDGKDCNVGEIKYLVCQDNNVETIAMQVQRDIQAYVRMFMEVK